MKKGLRSAVVLALSAVALTSCTSKVEFSEFKTKANAALEKTVEYKSAKLTGKKDDKDIGTFNYTISSRVFTPSKDTAVGDLVNAAAYATLLVSTFNLGVYTVDDGGTGFTYYAGDSFKVEYSKTDSDKNTVKYSFEWNSVGLPTSVNGNAKSEDDKSSYSLKVSYSK